MIRPIRQEDMQTVQAILQENKQMIDGVDYTQWTHPTLVAVKDGEVVGMVQALLGVPYAVVTELSIARQVQNQGYGTRLIQHLETALRLAGVSAYVAYVADTNESMIEQFERYGAISTGCGRGFVRRL